MNAEEFIEKEIESIKIAVEQGGQYIVAADRAKETALQALGILKMQFLADIKAFGLTDNLKGNRVLKLALDNLQKKYEPPTVAEAAAKS